MQYPDRTEPLDPPASRAAQAPRPHALATVLRLATADAHAAVERLPSMARLTSPTVVMADYRRYIAAMAGLYGTLEPPLYAALRSGLPRSPGAGPQADLGLRPKTPTLRAELLGLGLPVPAPAPAGGGDAFAPADLSAALGGLYVLEGATLGGRVIARHLRRHLGDAIPPGGLLDFHGDRAAAAWKGFAAALDALVAAGAIDPERTVAAALTVFDLVYRALAAAESPADVHPCATR